MAAETVVRFRVAVPAQWTGEKKLPTLLNLSVRRHGKGWESSTGSIQHLGYRKRFELHELHESAQVAWQAFINNHERLVRGLVERTEEARLEMAVAEAALEALATAENP